MDWLRRALAEFFQMCVGRRSEILWFDAKGILRDIDGRPIRQTSVSKERVRAAWRKRREERRISKLEQSAANPVARPLR